MVPNPKESKLLAALTGASFRKGRHAKPKASLTVPEMASRCFPGVRPAAKAHAWVRSSLRRLVASSLVVRGVTLLAGERAIYAVAA